MFDYNYLQQLISDGIEESPGLEYKAAGALAREDKKVMEITKDVSAFANSNGGILIYGLAEDQMHRHLPGKIDPVNRHVISKEWLEQIINSRIRPRIHGLKIHVVTIPGSDDDVVYILEIPKGETAHQADDRRYYRRHNFSVESLYDHEVRDIMGRQKNPDILIEFKLEWHKGINPDGYENRKPNYYLMHVYAKNVGKVYAKYINVLLTLPQRCTNIHSDDRYNKSLVEITADNKVRDLIMPNAQNYLRTLTIAKPPEYGPARYEPLLPGMHILLKSIPIHEYSTDVGNEISWITYADNSESKFGSLEFHNMKRV
ncbi:hypothetical protein GCM10023231_12430 [Olivibacter ginsenosidimutans]|uniref:Schlafen AlbA-2 domain-containing protein n=1 Tax=Olivibacter ginsenosidimutans TaxID=1176537 RepID=A0ABP9AU98_9SPHI